jgi:hypothetical protein
VAVATCLKLGTHPHDDFKALRRWAHMLRYRGHFATKSRRYSATMRVLRAARSDWRRRQNHLTRRRGQGRRTEAHLEWAERGWHTNGGAHLALSAAAWWTRQHRRIAP